MIQKRFSKFLLLTTVSLSMLTSCGYLEKMGMDLEPERVSIPIEDVDAAPEMMPEEALGASGPVTQSLNSLPPLDPVNMSTDERLDRLETVVTGLQQNMQRIAPAVENLMGLEDQINTLLLELQSLRTGEAPEALMPLGLKESASAPPTVLVAQEDRPKPIMDDKAADSTPKTVAQKQEEQEKSALKRVNTSTKAAPPASEEPVTAQKAMPKKVEAPQASSDMAPATIQNIRVGSYPNKTRIVFDVKGKPAFGADLDRQENLFTVSFANGVLASDLSISPLKNTLVSAVSETNSDNGKMIIFALTQPTRILKQEVLPPSRDSQFTRVFFDFAK